MADPSELVNREFGSLKHFNFSDRPLYHGTDDVESAARLVKHGADPHHFGGRSRQLGSGMYVTTDPDVAAIHGKYIVKTTIPSSEAEKLHRYQYTHKTHPSSDAVGEQRHAADFRTTKYNKLPGKPAEQICFSPEASKGLKFEVHPNMHSISLYKAIAGLPEGTPMSTSTAQNRESSSEKSFYSARSS